MKIRIKGNSLRLRLTQTELKHFASEGKVEEVIQFGLRQEEQLRYSLESFDGEAIEADYGAGKIAVKVPLPMAQHWTSSEQVGLSQNIHLGEEKILSILIEKDFQCMKTRVGEDESDNFPNPEV